MKVLNEGSKTGDYPGSSFSQEGFRGWGNKFYLQEESNPVRTTI
jgi:hypothetical protein